MREFYLLTKDGRKHTILATSVAIAEYILISSSKRYNLRDIRMTYEVTK